MTTETAFVFVIGTGRCGSSLVHEILAQHEDVGFISNIDDRLALPAALGRWNGPIYRRLPLVLTEKGRARFAPSEGYRVLARQVSPMLSRSTRDLVASDVTPLLGSRFRRFFHGRAAAQRRDVFLHKFTGWPRAGFIDAAIPGARFIHVIRDGRAVANSLLQMAWWRGFEGPTGWGWGPLTEDDERAWEAADRSFAVLAGLEWKVLMDAFADAKASIDPGRWIDVRYEDLLRDPTGTVKELIEFARLPWTSTFEERFRRYRFRDSRIDSFHEELPRNEVAILTRLLEDRLLAHGYGPGAGNAAVREPGSDVLP
jgi:hypothetical protein